MPGSGSTRLVALALPPGPGFWDAIRQVWEDGDAALPLPHDAPDGVTRQLVEAFRPGALVDEAGVSALDGEEPVDDGVALVCATSGSTGDPRGAEFTQHALDASVAASMARIGGQAGDRWMCCLPTHHMAGLQVLLRAQAVGTAPIILPRFDVQAVDAASEATHVSLVPTMLRRLLDAGVDLRRFGCVLLGGAAPPAELVEEATAAGARVVVTYGLTETCGGCVYDGRPLDGVAVALDPSERILEGAGRILVRGPVLFQGYRLDPEATAAAMDQRGWLRTDDVGRWGEGGRLRVLGRTDDVIVSGGENVAPAAVERALAAHPAVVEVAVVGLPDPEWGEQVVAVVVPRGELPPLDDLRALVREEVGAAAAPHRVVVVSELPLAGPGKVDRAALREQAERLSAKPEGEG